jgi:curved DNA-binding protein
LQQKLPVFNGYGTMNFKDYYEILGIERDATQDQIKRAYRKLARKYHPDVSDLTDAETRFKEVGEAYEVLKDPEKRAAYNQLGENWQAGQQFETPPNWDAGFEFSGGGFTQGDSSAFSDFFESLFGRGFSPGTGGGDYHAHGEDHHARVLIDIEDAYQGTSRTVTLQSPGVDSEGHITSRQRTLKVKIPKGVKQGQKIRLAGQGMAGSGEGTSGDLYLEIDFAPHEYYRVEGKDVYLDLPVAPWEAALGRKVKAPTPGGVVDISIPTSARSGQKLRLKGRGIPAAVPGDVYVTLRMVTPLAKGDIEKKLYRQMEEEFEFNPRSELGV